MGYKRREPSSPKSRTICQTNQTHRITNKGDTCQQEQAQIFDLDVDLAQPGEKELSFIYKDLFVWIHMFLE